MARQQLLSRSVSALAGLAGVFPVLALVGWVAGVQGLKLLIAGGNSMKPNTALALAAASVALGALEQTWKRVALGAGAIAATFGLLTLAARPVGLEDAFDHLFWPTQETVHMAKGTALSLIAIGLGLAASVRPSAARLGWVQAGALFSLVISTTALVAYSAGLTNLIEAPLLESMALNTSLSLALLSLGLLLHTRAGPFTRPFFGPSAAATLGRRLLLVVSVVPWLLGLAVLELVRRGAFGSVFGFALLIVLTMGALIVAVSRFTALGWRGERDLGVTLDSIGDAVLLADAGGRVVRLNPVAERLTGWPLARAHGLRVEDVFQVVDRQTRQPLESPVRRVLREGGLSAPSDHTSLVDRQGIERPISHSAAPVRGPDGELQGVVLVFRDMTAEVEVRSAQERTAANFKAVLDAVPVGLVAARSEKVVFANQALAKMLGFGSPDELLGRPFLELLAPEEEHLSRARGAAWGQGKPVGPRRVRMVGPAGEQLVDSHPLPTPVELDGQPAFLLMVQLVSDREGLERRLARRNAAALGAAELSGALAEVTFDLQSILDTVVGIVARAPDEVALLQLWSRTDLQVTQSVAVHSETPALLELARRFGSQSQAGGLNGLLRKSGRALTFSADQFRQQATPRGLELLGESIPHHLALIPMRGRSQILGLVAVARYAPRPFDEDDLLHLQELADRAGQAVINAQLFEEVKAALEEKASAARQLQATEAQLRHSQKLEALGQLAGGVAHDFNNLLSVILGLCSMMIEGREPGDPDGDDLRDIEAAGKRAAELTRQLLAFSRKQVMQLQPLELSAVVRENERILRRLLSEDVTLTLELAPSLGLVRADASLLTQVLMNLVVNARDAMPEGGRLSIRTTRAEVSPGVGPSELPAGSYLCLQVEDQGSGLTPEVRERVFEPFFTTKARGKGTGLGLSTSYGIARQSGGTISVDSVPGQGATFTVWLPLMTAVSRTPTPSALSQVGPVNAVILLVEDEPLVREVAQRVLERAGYTLHLAGSAAEALVVAQGIPQLDLLLTDVVMPGRSGRELADELVRVRPGLPVLFMSGYTEDVVVQRGVHDGQMALLQKPFTPSSLLAAVGQALAARAPHLPG